MEIPAEIVAAKESLERTLLAAGFITGIDFGVRDEDEPDPQDTALRIFVADLGEVPFEVQLAASALPFPVVVLQRVFTVSQLRDVTPHRPLVGGVSVVASRFLASDNVPVGTLGAIVRDQFDPTMLFGLSNHHVLCHDLGRTVGDEIVQPEPTALGRLPDDRVGTLARFSFPETTPSGTVDAAICLLEVDSLPEVVDVGPVFGTVEAQLGMLVSKRGRTTGLTFGVITGTDGSYALDFPQFLPVGTPPSTVRTLTNQIQVRADFPQSIVFGESGDSGSVVLGGEFNRVVGLYWGSGSDSFGDPLRFGLLSPSAAVQSELGIVF